MAVIDVFYRIVVKIVLLSTQPSLQPGALSFSSLEDMKNMQFFQERDYF